MEDDTKGLIEIQLSMLKQTMAESGIILALIVDKKNIDNSKIAFVKKDKYMQSGICDGFSISLTEFNKDLI